MVRRGRFLRPPVLAALALLPGLAGCGDAGAPVAPAPATAPAPPPVNPADPLDLLIAQLGDSSYAKREEAERRLTELAPDRYAALQEAVAKTTDLEIQSRLERILASPRIRLAAAWRQAVREGAQDLALRETWFRTENENVPVGYQRLSLRREGEGLEASFEMATGNEEGQEAEEEPSFFRVSYLLDAQFKPVRLKAEHATPGEPVMLFEGRMEDEGWIVTATPPGRKTRLPWGSEDFPQEALLPFLPLWTRSGAPGREILHNDIEYPSLVLKPMAVRDEGKDPRRLAFFLQGSDKPFLTLFLDAKGAISDMLWSNNLKGTRVSPEEGRALQAGLEKRRRKASGSP